ncbi:MAG: tetratricopeptide repeat protein [Deferrisomatales bacterium]|nr:tetratricopeptide repeat protein [Deferrisomatales bacterium]
MARATSSPSRWAAWVGGALYRAARGCQTLSLLVLLAFLGAGCAADKEARQREAQSSFQLGMAFLSEGRPAPALREFTKAESLEPEDPKIQYYLGATYWLRREHSLAEEKFRRAVDLKPDYSEAWNDLGALYMDQGRYEAAIPAFEAALKNVFYATQERALANLGRSLARVGRTAEAERRLREAVEVAPGFPLAHKFLGELLQDRGDHGSAVAEFDRALRALPDDADTHLKRGVSLLRLGDRAAARESFDRAWRLAPGGDVGQAAKTYLDLLGPG